MGVVVAGGSIMGVVLAWHAGRAYHALTYTFASQAWECTHDRYGGLPLIPTDTFPLSIVTSSIFPVTPGGTCTEASHGHDDTTRLHRGR